MITTGTAPDRPSPSRHTNHAGRPRVLLIGAGRFGIEHLKEWIALDAAGEVSLAGVVVRTDESVRRLEGMVDVPLHVGMRGNILDGIDGVDIVTPVASHERLIRECLEKAHVLVEKPLASDAQTCRELGRLARDRGRLLFVGHVYRFHPMLSALRAAVAECANSPRLVTGRFTNPTGEADTGTAPRLEFLHLFDLVDLLFGAKPEFCLSVTRGRMEEVSLRYAGQMNAVLQVGWGTPSKHRQLGLVYEDRRIDCDFATHTLVIQRREDMERTCVEAQTGALRAELRAFAASLRGEVDDRLADADTGARIVDAACRKVEPTRTKRPRVAVVGAGVFGATCAIELAGFCDVTLFERHADLLTEASYLNQWRHHSGFHYPRSPQTVAEVKCSRDEFMERYRRAVMKDFPSYFCTAASAQEITAERYLAICQTNGLNFRVVPPPSDAIVPGSVSLCLETDEGIIDFDCLKRMIETELAASHTINVRMRTEVVGGCFGADGSKQLSFRGPEGTRTEAFDFLVNATYANRNLMTQWFRFPRRLLRFDLLELLVLNTDLAKVSVTVLDGPFTSLTTMGKPGLFMLSHIEHSVLKSVVTADGAPPDWGRFVSNQANLLRAGARYFPAVGRARLVESRYGVRAVYAYSEDFDGRPTVVTEHGFGCWSVLGGKIITCVRNAREIADAIHQAMQGAHAQPVAREGSGPARGTDVTAVG